MKTGAFAIVYLWGVIGLSSAMFIAQFFATVIPDELEKGGLLTLICFVVVREYFRDRKGGFAKIDEIEKRLLAVESKKKIESEIEERVAEAIKDLKK